MVEEAQSQQVSSETENIDNKTEAVGSAEKTVPQSEVNRVIGAVKVEAFEKGKKAALEELRQHQSSISLGSSTTDDKIVISKDELKKVVADQAAQQASQRDVEHLVTQFSSKLSTSNEKYKDFDDTVGKLDLPSVESNTLYRLLQVTTAVDNTADVMYELGKNPNKYANLLILCQNNPRLAQEACSRLSNSIKKNETAMQQSLNGHVNEPLNHIKSSTNGTDNGVPRSVSDFRKLDWLRG